MCNRHVNCHFSTYCVARLAILYLLSEDIHKLSSLVLFNKPKGPGDPVIPRGSFPLCLRLQHLLQLLRKRQLRTKMHRVRRISKLGTNLRWLRKHMRRGE